MGESRHVFDTTNIFQCISSLGYSLSHEIPWYYSPVLCSVLLVNSFHQVLLVLIPGEAHVCLIARHGKRFVGFVQSTFGPETFPHTCGTDVAHDSPISQRARDTLGKLS